MDEITKIIQCFRSLSQSDMMTETQRQNVFLVLDSIVVWTNPVVVDSIITDGE